MRKILTLFALLAAAAGNAFALPSVNSVVTNSGTVGQYEKLELTIGLTASYTKPFDYDTANGGVSVWAVFTPQSGPQVTVNGFFMDTNNDGTADSWKARFSTGTTGTWSYTVYVRDATGEAAGTPGSFTVAASAQKGFIRKSQANAHYFAYENGGSFWGVGHNNGWQYSEPFCPQCIANPSMETMRSNGEDLLLFWMNSPWRTPSQEPQRAPMENITGGIGNYNQRAAKYLDDKMEAAETAGIKLILSVWAHDNLRAASSCTGWSSGNWQNLAYSSVCSAAAFISDAASLSYQAKFYRYINARWGYSRALFMWDLVVEANGTEAWCGGEAAYNAWLQTVRDNFTAFDPFSHPATASLGGGWNAWDSDPKWPGGYAITGVSQMHSYEYKNDMAMMPKVIARDSQYMWSLGRPGMIGEFGTSVPANQPVDLHRAAWAGLCAGASLEPLLWCDGGTSYVNMTAAMLEQQRYLAAFTAGIDFENMMTGQKTAYAGGGTYSAWAMGSADFAVAWLYNSAGNIESGRTLTLSSFNNGLYLVSWYNTWTGTVQENTSVTVSSGSLSVTVPQPGYPDIACKVSWISTGATPTPTFTPVITSTPTPANNGQVYVYPAVVRMDLGAKGVQFRNLQAGDEVTVYNLAGEAVYSAVKPGDGQAVLFWDISQYKTLVRAKAPGIYIYNVRRGAAYQKGKFAVVR